MAKLKCESKRQLRTGFGPFIQFFSKLNQEIENSYSVFTILKISISFFSHIRNMQFTFWWIKSFPMISFRFLGVEKNVKASSRLIGSNCDYWSLWIFNAFLMFKPFVMHNVSRNLLDISEKSVT
jgi:hypothetical protein